MMKNPEDRYVKVGETNTRYWVLGQGSPLLLIHGLGASCDYWRYNVRALSQGYQVYVLDLPGFGRSDKKIDDYSLHFAGEFVAAFLDAQGVDRASLVGNSLGGAVSLQFAVQYPHRLEKLVLVSSGGLGRELPLSFRLLTIPLLGESIAWAWGTRVGTRLTLRSIVYDPQVIKDEFVNEMVDLARLPGAKEMLLSVARAGIDLRGQNMKLLEPLLRRVPEIEAPTLIIWGAQDPIIPVAHAHIAHQMIRNSRLHIFDRCGHVPQIEKPEEFNRLVLEFLGSN
jgi:4,5:9,10-diseco-3-hydroxy-5,9,17-trioxoandrosta-1(10),2-diene-4-oate hydrolase